MAFDTFLKVEGIPGESTDDKHQHWIDTLDYARATSSSQNSAAGSQSPTRFDAFLKLDGIKGESADHKHKGEIDIESFAWGLSQTGVSATGGGGGAGKVKVHDIHFWKRTDASSPLLFLNCANGAHIKEASFVVRKAGGEQLEYLKIKLTDVLVSSYKPNAAGGGPHHPGGANDEIPTDRFSLNFAKIEFSYQQQGADGKAQGGPIVAGWDVTGNVKA